LPSARTSAGKKYKYKVKKKETAAATQPAADCCQAVQVRAVMDIALRHVIDRKSGGRQVSTLTNETLFLGYLDG
jgi:hypothetical protein